MTMRTVLLLANLFTYSLAAKSAIDLSPDFPVHVDISDYGLYRLLDKKDQDFSAETTAGYASVIRTRHVAKTDKVILKKGQVFGFNYLITDTSTEQEWVPVTIDIKHPATTNYLGKRSTGFSLPSAAKRKEDGRYHNGAFYIFSENYEMVPGEWTISVIYRGKYVVSKRFTVESPPR